MLEYGLAFGAGLIVGWNVLPQPAWVRAIYVAAELWWNTSKED